ncbi:E3 ubiquitin-protein ligase RNF31-like [Chanos chanos]|uniref:E3 ubiquitin-protein ligase RNF31-like n=1 Tax=Chanos chanos TaxID=29144 RepID=A0A6J2VDU9_CHACN|nr:E3 ubiquitin-protein ligase RNF31-like [Chanos chanos]
MLRPKQTEPPATPCSPSTPTACDMCGEAPSFICSNCGSLPYCERCDAVVHRHPEKVAHKRDHISPSQKENCAICGLAPVAANCPTCAQRLCTECDKLRHSHPDRKGHRRMPVNITKAPESLRLSFSSWECTQCSTVNHARAVTCRSCGRPPLGNASPAGQEASSPSTPSEWECKSCTMVNSGTSVLCEVCERPRLATRPPITPEQLFPPKPNPPVDTEAEWTCKHCTFVNSSPSAVCEMCNLSRNEPVVKTNKSPPLENTMQHFEKPQVPPRQVDLKRQESMRNEGLTLIRYIRDGEKRGISPEEVYAALNVSGGSNVDPFDWLQSELPHLLDEICAVVASIQDNKTAKDGQPQSGEVLLSRAEAKQAWLDAGGNTEKAVQKLLKSRQAKTRELQSLGFTDRVKCEEALRVSGGDLNGALTHLQHPLLEPLRQRIWSEQTEIIIDPKDPDKEKTCRRLLALYDLPSWGRCELAWSLLQEPGAEYTLDDVVQAVKQHHDRDFVRRMLVQDCAICYCNFPFSKMASLISCQCSICNECFQEHFTVAVKDKHIRDMVCPACGEPDINDPEALYNYFSILDSQLKNCLKRDVHELFMKKLAEYTLMQDPKFLWCSHCTNGFIYDGTQLKVTCQACHKSFCSKCKKPWEDQHENVTCEQFQTWKRENDPEYQRQGLAGYIRDNGIKCPGCGFQYALAKGGCMHFTCSQCRHEFCSGCNGPYHKTGCPVRECTMQNGLHAHHPRDCLFYLRDWEPPRLQALLQKSGVEFNTEPPNGIQTGECGVMEQKDEAGQHVDSPCGHEVALGHAGLCDKHYREYLVSLINEHALDPAPLFDKDELVTACKRYYIDHTQEDNEDDVTYHNRLLQKLMELPLGEKIPRKK